MQAPILILVGTSHPGNVGAAARGAANFGVEQMRFVAPRCDIRDPLALSRARHASHLLENATVHGTLQSALDGVSMSVGTTARTTLAEKRFLRKPLDIRDWTASLDGWDGQLGIVFGREDSGLTAEEVNMLDQLVIVPTADYSSLNLAHAISIVCYEVFRLRSETRTIERTLSPNMLAMLHRAFDDLANETDPRPWRHDVAKGLWRRILARSLPDDREARAILGIFVNSLKRFNHPDYRTDSSTRRLGERGLLVTEDE